MGPFEVDSRQFFLGLPIANCNQAGCFGRVFSKIIWVFPKNRGTPKSSILIGFSTINPSIFRYPYFWKHLYPTFRVHDGHAGIPVCLKVCPKNTIDTKNFDTKTLGKPTSVENQH